MERRTFNLKDLDRQIIAFAASEEGLYVFLEKENANALELEAWIALLPGQQAGRGDLIVRIGDIDFKYYETIGQKEKGDQHKASDLPIVNKADRVIEIPVSLN